MDKRLVALKSHKRETFLLADTWRYTVPTLGILPSRTTEARLKLTTYRLLALAWLGLALPAAAREDSVSIAAVYSKTGSLYDVAAGQGYFNSMRMALDDVNKRGGLLGKRVELLEFDSRSTPLGAREAARAIVKVRPLAVIGEMASSMSLAMAPSFQQAGIPMISPKSTHPDLTAVGDYIFRVCYQDVAQGQAMADFAREQLKARTAVILTNASQKFSVELAHHFSARFRAHGGSIAREMDYLADTDDFGALAEATRQLGADVVFIPGYAKDAGLLIKRLRAQGVKGVFLGGDGWGIRIAAYAGEAAEGSYWAGHWHRDDPGKTSRAYVAAYEKRFGKIQAESAALAYDAVQLLVDAVRRANSFEPERVRAALAETHQFSGVTGSITFDARRNPIKPVAILQWRGGRDVFIKSVTP